MLFDEHKSVLANAKRCLRLALSFSDFICEIACEANDYGVEACSSEKFIARLKRWNRREFSCRRNERMVPVTDSRNYWVRVFMEAFDHLNRLDETERNAVEEEFGMLSEQLRRRLMDGYMAYCKYRAVRRRHSLSQQKRFEAGSDSEFARALWEDGSDGE